MTAIGPTPRLRSPWLALVVATVFGLCILGRLFVSSVHEVEDGNRKAHVENIRESAASCPPIWRLARLIVADGDVTPPEQRLFDETILTLSRKSAGRGPCTIPDPPAYVDYGDTT